MPVTIRQNKFLYCINSCEVSSQCKEIRLFVFLLSEAHSYKKFFITPFPPRDLSLFVYLSGKGYRFWYLFFSFFCQKSTGFKDHFMLIWLSVNMERRFHDLWWCMIFVPIGWLFLFVFFNNIPSQKLLDLEIIFYNINCHFISTMYAVM